MSRKCLDSSNSHHKLARDGVPAASNSSKLTLFAEVLDTQRHLWYYRDSRALPLRSLEVYEMDLPLFIDQISSFRPGIAIRVFSFPFHGIEQE